VAALAAVQVVGASQEGLLHQVTLKRLPRRGRWTASAFPFFRRRWIRRSECLQLRRVGVACDALRGDAGLGRPHRTCAGKDEERGQNEGRGDQDPAANRITG